MTTGPKLTENEKSEIWRLRREGMRVSRIAKEVNRAIPTLVHLFTINGGIDPGARERSRRHLSLEEREEIALGLAQSLGVRAIARRLNRSPSTISREIHRYGLTPANYRASKADTAAWKLAARPKLCKLSSNKKLRDIVSAKLQIRWSPEQISLWLRSEFPLDTSMQVSHETIYKTLFIQSRGALKKELLSELRSAKKIRQSKKKHPVAKDGRGQIAGAISISERPASVEDRALPGHWEGDLIAGTDNSYIATLVERATRFTVLVKVKSKRTDEVVSALIRQMKKLPDILKGSLTWDRGSELQQHVRFTFETEIDVYFCDPSSPWQRGTNENTNRLLRQYFPKGTSLHGYSQMDLDAVAKELNERPRKTLNVETPAQRLQQVLR